jgi:hypothetical protein
MKGKIFDLFQEKSEYIDDSDDLQTKSITKWQISKRKIRRQSRRKIPGNIYDTTQKKEKS